MYLSSQKMAQFFAPKFHLCRIKYVFASDSFSGTESDMPGTKDLCSLALYPRHIGQKHLSTDLTDISTFQAFQNHPCILDFSRIPARTTVRSPMPQNLISAESSVSIPAAWHFQLCYRRSLSFKVL